MLCSWLLPVCEGQSERQLHTRAGFQSEGPLAPTRRIDTPCVIGFGDYAQTLLPTLSCSVFTYYSPAHPRTEESTSNRTSNAARKTRSQLPKPSPSLKVYSDTTFRRVGPSLDIDCPLTRNIESDGTVPASVQHLLGLMKTSEDLVNRNLSFSFSLIKARSCEARIRFTQKDALLVILTSYSYAFPFSQFRHAGRFTADITQPIPEIQDLSALAWTGTSLLLRNHCQPTASCS